MSRVGRAWFWTGFTLPFLFAAAVAVAQPLPDPPIPAPPLPAPPLPALAEEALAGPDGLPATNPKHPWKLFVGAPRVDTLSFALSDIIPVARRQFIHDEWQVFTVDPERGEIVTKWKQMHHPLLLIFMGHVNARCTVTMRPLDRNRTRMVFQADLASHRDLVGNPMLGAAKRAYAKAAHNYVTEVRGYLNSHRNLSSASR